MMKKFVFIILLSVEAVFAQVQFEAKVNKQSLALNEKLRIDFTVNGDGDDFVPPSFEGFRVFAGPYQSVKIDYVNGRGTFNKSYSFFLIPTKRGKITIKPASIDVNGKIYKTAPVTVTITEPVEHPRDPNDASQPVKERMAEALTLVAEVSKSNPYINEPITVVYKLYFDYGVIIREYRELEKPKYNDFWSQNIEIKRPEAVETTFNGKRCVMAVLKKTVLYPQKSGKLEIEPLTLDLDMEMPSQRRFFGQPVMVRDNRRVSAGARTITVRSLPEKGKPEDFSGAVGRFNFTVTPSKTNVKSGESVDLVVSVAGTGNLKLFNLPKPVVPAALEMYDPVHKENVSTPLSGMTGKITDSYTIIPQYKGKYPIQPMSFSYFDLASGKYKTITSPEIMLNVLDGPVPSDVALAAEQPKAKISGSNQFEFIKLKTRLTPMNQDDFFGSGGFIAAMLLPFLCIPLVIAARRKKDAIDRDIVGNKRKMSNKLAKKYLSEARKHIGNKEPFYVALEKAMHNFLKAKLHIETFEMSKDRIREILLRKARPETVNAFIALMESCEFARYAPSTEAAMQDDCDQAERVISELEKQL
jgi:hypothetical protein